MKYNRKQLEDIQKKLESSEFDEKNIDLNKDASTQLAEEITNSIQANIRDVFSEGAVEDEDRDVLARIKTLEQEAVKDITKKQIEAMKKKIESIDVPDHIARIHFENPEDFKRKLLEHFVQPGKTELIQQYESAQELKDTFELKFEESVKKHVGIVAEESTPEAVQFINDFQLPEELLSQDLTKEQFDAELKKLMKKHAKGGLKDELREHDDLIEKLFEKAQVKDASKNKFEDYEKKHVGALEKKLGREVIDALQRLEITDAMAEPHISIDDFDQKMKNLLIEGNAELKKALVEHPELADKIFGSENYKDAKEDKYEAYENKHGGITAKKLGAGIAAEIDALEIPQEYLDQEMTPDEFQNKIYNSLAAKNQTLQKEDKEHPNVGIATLTRQQESVKSSLQRKQESLENKKSELTKAEILTEMNSMDFTDAEIGNESLHKNQQAFAEAFKGRLSPKLLEKIKKRGPKMEAFFQEQLKTTLYSRWEQQHEAAEKEEKKSELLKAARNEPLPSEWASEDLSESQFMQKYFDLLADKDPELLEPQHQTMRAELFRDAELQAALKLRHKDFLETKEAKILDEAKNEMEKMTFTDDEKRREEFHDNAEEFATFVLDEKLSPEVRAKIDKLSPQKKDEYQKQLRQQAKGKLYKNWKEQHESIEEADAKSKLIDLIRNQERTPAGMKDVFASAEDFKNAMWQSALTKDDEWGETQHQSMIGRLSKDAQIVQALDDRYSFYREKFQEVANREIKEEVSKIDFSPAEIDNDEFHDNEEGFAEYMYSKKLSPKLLKKIASLPGLEENAKKQLRETTYQQWLKKHETAEEKKFTKELEEKILGQELPPDFANTHYEAKDFQEKWFELIKGNLSDDLKNEHAEELKKLLGKDRVQNAFAKKFEEYEVAHDKAMEQKFSAELANLNASVGMSAELIQKSLSPDEFKKEWFALLLKNASPELLEELEEHADLREKLFKHQQLQVGMESHYKKYKLEHDKGREIQHAQELTPLIQTYKFPADMLKGNLTEAQFMQEMMTRLLKSASLELQKDTDLQKSLLTNPKLRAEFAKKYAEYQKALKKPEKKEAEKPGQKKAEKEKLLEEKLAQEESLEKETEEAQEAIAEQKETPEKRLKEEKKMDADNIEAATEEDLKDGLDKVLDMSKGQERLLELKKLPFLKNILRKNHLKRGLEPMIVEWTAQLKPADFRMFKMVLMRRGSTPEKMLHLMATTPLRRKALNRIRKFSQKTWFKFAQSIKYLQLTPAQAFQTVPATVKPLEKQKDLLSETHLSETTSEVEAPVDEPFEVAEEDFTFLENDEETFVDENQEEIANIEEDLVPEEELVHLEQSLQAETTEEMQEMPEGEKVKIDFNEEQEPVTSLPEQVQVSADEQPFEIQSQPPLEMEENLETVPVEAEKQEELLSEAETFPETGDEQQQKTEIIAPVETLVAQEEPLTMQAEPLVEPEEPLPPAATTERVSEENLEKFVTPPTHEEPVEAVLPPTSEENPDVVPVEALDEQLQTPRTPEQHSEEIPLLQKERTPEKQPVAKKPEVMKTSTDPLKELEKFRSQLMKQFKRNAQLAQMQKTFDLMGINIEPFYEMASEESSEFLESLRLEMETNSMSLGSLLKKFVRYVRFITDFEIPAQYDIAPNTLEMLLSQPAEVFKALNEHYFTCRANHEKTTEMIFTCRDLGKDSLNLMFEVHKNEVSQTCAALITCALVPGQHKKVTA